MIDLVKIWCEWDIGHENCVFPSEEIAREWLEKNNVLQDIYNNATEPQDLHNLDEVFDCGLVGYEAAILIENVKEYYRDND